MTTKIGLARFDCPRCAQVCFVPTREMLNVSAVACPHCFESINVADVEARDSGLDRVLKILRGLAEAKAAHRLQCDQVRTMPKETEKQLA